MKQFERHIRSDDKENSSICDEDIGHNFAFNNIDHAFHCIKNGDFLLPCPDCVQEVMWTFEECVFKDMSEGIIQNGNKEMFEM